MSSFATIQTEVEALYIGYFMRAGDPGGTQYWINQIQNGTLNLAQAAASFSVQLETLGDYPFLATGNLGAPVTELGVSTYTNVYNFINQVYEDLFNRTVDAGGLAYWSAQLVANIGKPQAFGDFIINVISGAATGGADDLTLQAKVAVASYITNSVYSAGLTWNSALQTESEILIAATTNASGSVATEEAAWFSYISSSLVPTFTLTTGVDAPGMGAFVTPITGNNNIVSGLFNDGAASTFTPGDNIVGPVGATGNTVTLYDGGTGGTANPTTVAATVSNMEILNVISGEALTVNTTGSEGWSGLTNLNVTSSQSGANVDTITAAATTAINVTDTASGNLSGNLTVNGGSTVAISEANGGFTVAGHTITVNGGTGTTSVSVTQTETTAGTGHDQSVLINDVNAGSTTKAGTITSVTIDGLDANGATINDNSLSSLTVNDVNTAATVTLVDSLTTPTSLTLALNLNNNTAAATIATSNDYTTINVTTGALASTAIIKDTADTALTVAGSSTLTLTGAGTLGAVKSIAVSGGAGLVDTADFALSAALTSVTDTSSGPVTLALNDTVASFSGGTATGTEIITITSDATKAITGDGVSTSEIVFNAAATTFTSANTGANVTGFDVLGVGAAGSGTFNMGASPFKGYTAVDDQGANGAVSFTNAPNGTPLAIDAAPAAAANESILYQLAAGATSAVDITLGLTASEAAVLGLAATTGGFSVVGSSGTPADSELTLWDSNFVGIATVNFTVNNSTAGSAETINYLNDQSLGSMSIAGTGDLVITQTYTDTLASLSITDNSTSTAGLTFTGGVTDNALTTLALAGSNTATMTLSTLTDAATSLTVTDSYAGNVTTAHFAGTAAMATESFTNTGAGTLTIGNTSASDTAVHSLTLVGSVSDYHGASTGQDTYTGGITVTGGTDNAVVVFETTAAGGAAAGKVDNITLGNGNDIVLDDGVGTVNITLGTGGNTVTTAAGATVTEIFGAHTAATADVVTIGATGTSLTAIATITGLNASGSDTITFAGDGSATGAVINENTNIGNYLAANHLTATLLNDVTAVLSNTGGDLAQHAIGEFTFSGTTYLIEQAGATGSALAAGDTVVALVGVTLTSASSAAAGVLTLHG